MKKKTYKHMKLYVLIIFSQTFILSKGHATYTCPITNVTIKEHKLSKENNILKLKDSSQNPDEVFSVFKNAISKIRSKVSNQIDDARLLRIKNKKNDDSMEISEVEKNKEIEKIEKKEALILHNLLYKNPEIETYYGKRFNDFIKKEDPKVFSYAKFIEEDSNSIKYEIYSISGEFKIANRENENEKIYFANVKPIEERKLSYFNPVDQNKANLVKEDIFGSNEKIQKFEEKYDIVEEKFNDFVKKVDEYNKESNVENNQNSKIDSKKKMEGYLSFLINLFNKTLEPYKFAYHNSNKVKNIHEGKAENGNQTRFSDAEAKILEKLLDLTSPTQQTRKTNDLFNQHRNYLAKFKSLKLYDLNQDIRGTLKIYTSLETCPSCNNAYVLFDALRPNIKLEIYTLNKELQMEIYKNNN
ncbi:hypothetical protein [Pigmentibacter ruber]|uniref:hypothetical protein n=1 Tax=Pigmentibacter ruber TaxID=2683196 RepID=UPI00131D277B|nr:hypothetical protein [Pigmentibacter ruber]